MLLSHQGLLQNYGFEDFRNQITEQKWNNMISNLNIQLIEENNIFSNLFLHRSAIYFPKLWRESAFCDLWGSKGHLHQQKHTIKYCLYFYLLIFIRLVCSGKMSCNFFRRYFTWPHSCKMPFILLTNYF